jgi:hypothetical protein
MPLNVHAPPPAQAESYKYMGADGQFVFGHDDCWILAPDRHGAHNWEGTVRTLVFRVLFCHVACTKHSKPRWCGLVIK